MNELASSNHFTKKSDGWKPSTAEMPEALPSECTVSSSVSRAIYPEMWMYNSDVQLVQRNGQILAEGTILPVWISAELITDFTAAQIVCNEAQSETL